MKPVKSPPSSPSTHGANPQPGLLPASDDLSLPHERDQSTDMTAKKPDPKIRQAGRDLDRGLQDTSKSPEMNRAYNKLK